MSMLPSNHQERGEGRIIDDTKVRPVTFYRRVGLWFVGVAAVVAVVWAGTSYYYLPFAAELAFYDEIDTEIPTLIDQTAPVEFVLVPVSVVDDAIATLFIPATTSDQLIWDEGEIDRQGILSDAEVDSVYNFPVAESHFGELVNASPLSPTLFQMLDEIRELVYQVNAQTGQATAVLPLGERVGRAAEVRFIESVTFGTPAITTTAPSLRVVEAEVVGLLLSHLFPTEAEYYKSLTDDYIDKGIIYGLYGPEDIVLSKGVARLYWEAFKNSPSFTTFTNEATTVTN